MTSRPLTAIGLCLALAAFAAAPRIVRASTSDAAPASETAAAPLNISAAADTTLAPAQRLLLEQARHWELNHRPDLARNAWTKLLESAPGNADALYALGLIEIGRGHPDAARAYYARLKAVAPNDGRLPLLEEAIRTGRIEDRDIAEARRLVAEGKMAEAAAAYRRVLKGQAPPPALALEYYQTIGAQDAGWEEARDGLAKIVAGSPNDAKAALAYAQHLTYRETTRRDGIARLLDLAKEGPVAVEARISARAALLWLGATAKDVPLYRAYLALAPGDNEIVRKLAAAERPLEAADTPDALRAAGYAALDQKKTAAALDLFRRAVERNPKDAEAVAGLGIAHLRAGSWELAERRLGEAIALAPEKRAQWEKALASARYLRLLEAGRTASAAGKAETAERLFQEAIAAAPRGEVGARLLLAQHLEAHERAAEAEKQYRAVLADDARNEAAIEGLARILLDTGRSEEADALLERLPEKSGAKAGMLARRRADSLRRIAVAAERKGNLGAALSAWRDAYAVDPTDPWIRVDYARFLRSQGAAAQARRLVEGLSDGTEEDRYAAAIFLAEDGNAAEAAALIASIPESKRTAEMRAFETRLAEQRDIDEAVALWRKNRKDEARRRLALALQSAGRRPERLAKVANGYAAIGDSERAVDIMAMAAESPDAPTGVLLEEAALLMTLGRDGDAEAALRRLEERTLTPAEARARDRLLDGLAIRAADAARTQGDPAAAYDALQPSLERSPDDSGVLSALARIYEGAGRRREAEEIWAEALEKNPDDFSARRGAVNAALARRDLRRARALVEEGLRRAPRDARMHLLAAQVHRAAGEREAAQAALQNADRLLRAEGSAIALKPANPFRPAGAVTTAADNDDPRAAEIRSLAADLERERKEALAANASYVAAGPQYRSRSGETGMSRLTEITAPIQVSFAPHQGGRLTLEAAPTRLDAGSVSTDPNDKRRFGGGALGGPDAGGQGTTGVGLGFSYEAGSFRIDGGTTPLGFAITNPVGRVAWRPQLGDSLRLRVEAARQPIKDYLLSYAGPKDTHTGRTWGGVVASEGRLGLEYDDGKFGAYGSVRYAFLEGKNVADNTMMGLNAGAFWRLVSSPTDELRVGFDLDAESYDRNLRYFTLGHGGYFSPQSSIAATVPVDYRVQGDRWTWNIGGMLGLKAFTEESTPLFPNDRDLQDALRGDQDRYAGQSETMVVWGLHGGGEYELQPGLAVGARLTLDNAGEWNEQRAFIYLKKNLE